MTGQNCLSYCSTTTVGTEPTLSIPPLTRFTVVMTKPRMKDRAIEYHVTKQVGGPLNQWLYDLECLSSLYPWIYFH